MADLSSDHGTHDLEAIAALADDPTPEGESRRVEAARCADCASLIDDLRLLATATAALPVPARTRDFRLDPADAARLNALAPEPELAGGRLGGEMTTPAPDHATHDPELVSAHLDGRLAPADLGRVEGWLAGCGACAVLHEDLQDLVVATRALPTPTRPRDFVLTPEDARRVRSGGWRRIVAAFGSPRDTVSRPLALGLTTLGIAGLLIANIPTLSFGSAAGAAPAPQVEMAVPSAGPAFAPDEVNTAAGENPIDTTGDGAGDPSAAAGIADTKSADPDQRETATDEMVSQVLVDESSSGPSWLVVGSLVMLGVGLTLALFRWRARRLGDG